MVLVTALFYVLKTGDYSTLPSMGHAVLPFHINSIFLNFLDIDEKVWKKNCWERGPEVIFNSGYDYKLITFLVRLPFMLLSLILAFYVVIRFKIQLTRPISSCNLIKLNKICSVFLSQWQRLMKFIWKNIYTNHNI